MKFVWVILVLVGVGLLFEWAKGVRKEEAQRLREKPASERYISGNLNRGKVGGAALDISSYEKAFVMFKLNKGRNPSSLKEVIEANYMPYGSEVDPFGQPYELQYLDNGTTATIGSPGPDRVRGTPDDVAARFKVD